MVNSNDTETFLNERPRIALITNHGYAGVEIPVGGAPDTGGQNFYVNGLAKALEDQGMEVTIFARGGFPFFGSTKIREGTEMLSEHVRYVYVPGGGSKFILKEDIAPALDEEIDWITRFICDEALEEDVAPWEYYECINSHYWDAAIIAIGLVERWQDQIAYHFLKTVKDGILAPGLKKFEGDNRHRLTLSREIHTHLGALALEAFPDTSPGKVLRRLAPESTVDPALITPTKGTAKGYRAIEEMALLGAVLMDVLNLDGKSIDDLFFAVDRHIWTPHSAGMIKKRNYWGKDNEIVRNLKFCERNNHEEVICSHTPLFCSTSPRIWVSLYSYQGVEPEAIFDFPPCIDTELFKPRTDDELATTYEYLSKASGVPVDKLKSGRIVFESSRMDRTKRKDLLLQAFAPIAEQTDDTYMFIGGGPQTSEIFHKLKRQIKKTPSLAGRVFLLGYIDEEVIESLFSIPTVFVSASEMEGFGMSVSQAAAAKVPIVSSNLIPFATQYCGDAAVIVKAGDVQGFTSAIMGLLDDPKDRAVRAEKLYAVANELNWNTTASKFIKWYRKKLAI